MAGIPLDEDLDDLFRLGSNFVDPTNPNLFGLENDFGDFTDIAEYDIPFFTPPVVPVAIKQEAKELLSQAVQKNNRPCLVAYNMLQILIEKFENSNGMDNFGSIAFPNLPKGRPLIWESVQLFAVWKKVNCG
jgi:hypothetical protein